MSKNAHYFISFNDRAYRSEISLYRHERTTAENAMMVRAPAGADQLYLVEGRRGAVSVFGNMKEAGAKFFKIRALALTSIAVVE